MPKPDKISNRVPEWKLQAAVCAMLDAMIGCGAPFAYAASLEGVIGNLNPYQAKLAIATGVKRGEPDLRLYFDGGRLVVIELKAEGGKLTQSQRERLPILENLGFPVHVVKASIEDQACELVRDIVLGYL
jgi:hypothetical protein